MKATMRTMATAGALVATMGAATVLADEPFGAPATVARWDFDVLLDGKDIGEHRFELVEAGDDVRLRTRAKFDVKFLFFNAYSYRHQSTEEWQDGCLTTLNAETDRNGDEISVTGSVSDDGFVVDGKAGEQTLDAACVMTFAYWNPAILEQDALLNTQTGDYQDVDVRYVGKEEVTAVGQTFDADRYEIDTGQGVIKLWYEQDNARWLALEAPAKGNRTIRYQLKDVPTLADSRTDLPSGGDRNDI